MVDYVRLEEGGEVSEQVSLKSDFIRVTRCSHLSYAILGSITTQLKLKGWIFTSSTKGRAQKTLSH